MLFAIGISSRKTGTARAGTLRGNDEAPDIIFSSLARTGGVRGAPAGYAGPVGLEDRGWAGERSSPAGVPVFSIAAPHKGISCMTTYLMR